MRCAFSSSPYAPDAYLQCLGPGTSCCVGGDLYMYYLTAQGIPSDCMVKLASHDFWQGFDQLNFRLCPPFDSACMGMPCMMLQNMSMQGSQIQCQPCMHAHVVNGSLHYQQGLKQFHKVQDPQRLKGRLQDRHGLAMPVSGFIATNQTPTST